MSIQVNESKTPFKSLRLRKHSGAILLLLVLLAGINSTGSPLGWLVGESPAYASTAKAVLAIGLPGAALLDPFTLNTGIPITNRGKATASNVEITSITLTGGATLTAPALPFSLGSVTTLASDGGMTPLFANFTSPNATLVPGGDYTLTVAGTYQSGATTYAFTASETLHIPEAAPGSASSNTASAAPHPPEGPFLAQRPRFTETDANESSSIEPIGPFVPVTPSSSTQVLDAADAGIQGLNAPAGTVTIPVNKGLGTGTFGKAKVREPSGASAFLLSGTVVVLTANSRVVYSTDGGSTFSKPLNPTTIFDKPWDSGFCCDQVVQYVPNLGFVWLMQTTPTKIAGKPGPNRLRIAVANPSDIATNFKTAWTHWDLTSSGTFGFSSNHHLDFPDMAVGNNYLYLSVDEVGYPNVGLFVMRIKLSELLARSTINFEYTHPEHGKTAMGGHLTQSPGDTIFWGGHVDTSTLRVFSWPENSNAYSWTDIGIGSYSNTNFSSPTLDGCDWMTKLNGSSNTPVRGATRSGDDLWLAWAGGPDGNFPQTHIEMVDLDIANNFLVKQQVQIWNPNRSFAYPALATNAATGEIGFSLEHGGTGVYENHAVGFWGDFTVYITTHSTAGTSRYGDYVTIRQNPTAKLFDAFGYEVLTKKGCKARKSDVHYVIFGRP